MNSPIVQISPRLLQPRIAELGHVKIGGDNKQTVDVKGAVANVASGAMTTAEQSLASNVGK